MAEARTRAALLLAQDGQRDGRAIVPRVYLLEATDATRRPPAFGPRLGTEIQHTLIPEFAWKSVTEGGPHFYPLVLWASTVTLFLLIGVFAMNRKELSYATAG